MKINRILLLAIIIVVSSCHSRYYRNSIEVLGQKDIKGSFKEVKNTSKVSLIHNDSVKIIRLNKMNLVFQNLNDKKYYIFLYSKDMTYEGYVCDSNLKVLIYHHHFGEIY